MLLAAAFERSVETRPRIRLDSQRSQRVGSRLSRHHAQGSAEVEEPVATPQDVAGGGRARSPLRDGFRSAHGWACSSSAANEMRSSSANMCPMNCTPTGSPASVQCATAD